MPRSAIRFALTCLIVGGLNVGGLNVAGLCVAGVAPAAAQSTPERGVFISQIGDAGRVDVTQQNADSLARIAQDGDGNQITLDQTGSAPHRAQIAQNGDGNLVAAQQDGDGTTDLALAQDGDQNTAVLFQNELSASAQTTAAVAQRGNGNTVVLAQDGSDNSARLDQVGNDNTMTATQLNNGNRLEWSQNGDGLADLGVVQTGNGNLQITQSTTDAQFAPPPGAGG